jgi:hypothetical protein
MRRDYEARAVSFDILSLVLVIVVGAFVYAILGGPVDYFLSEAEAVQAASGSQPHADGIGYFKTMWNNLPTLLVIGACLWGVGIAIVRRATP